MYRLTANDRRFRIFLELKRGISGEEIARKYGLSRTAIWKFVRRLEEMGYVFESRRGVGYRIVHSPDLSVFEIASVCFKSDLVEEVFYYEEVDSTNQRAREVGKPKRLFIAERQTRGRGRYGRVWVSDPGGLYFSITLPREIPLEDLPKITLTSGLAVARALNARLKWPNDVMMMGRKLCGILCEISGEIENPLVIVGIGINVNNKTPEGGISLREVEGKELRRIDVFRSVFESFEVYYKRLIKREWEEIRKEWIENSDTIGKRVVVRVAGKEYRGIAVDLDEDGGLILKEDEKTIRIFSGGCFYVTPSAGLKPRLSQ